MDKPVISGVLCGVILASMGIAHRASWAVQPGLAASGTHLPQIGDGDLPMLKPPSVNLRPPVAQLFFPPASKRSVLRVIGKGEASQPADTAQIELNIGQRSEAEDFPGGNLPEGDLFEGGPGVSLKRKDLQPIVDALIAAGIPEADIMVKISPPRSTPFPLPIPPIGNAGKATVVVEIKQPVRERIDAIATTAREAADQQGRLTLEGVNVRYAVDDCPLLEAKAYAAAVKDAQNRAGAIAQAMNATLVGVPSVAEPFYGVFLPGCNSEQRLPFEPDDASYDEADPIEVEVKRDIFVTYTVK